jgi:hypothetical protein
MKRWTGWISLFLAFALLVGCSNAGSYVQSHYPLVDVQGNGKDTAKVYSAENKDVPAVAKELANNETPQEMSKQSQDKMFLIYKDKIINIQKDPANDQNSLVELDTIQYAQENYGSTFLQGYLTATVLQSIFGGGWFHNSQTSVYHGYTSVSKSPSKAGDTNKPNTSERTGSFSSKSSTSDKSALTRKNDGSKPSYKSSGKPSTGNRSGSFSKRK